MAKIAYLFVFILYSLSLRAQDPFASSFKEERRSNDVALVLLNETDGKLVEGFSGFAMKNMLRSHYPEENILLLTKAELYRCMQQMKRKQNEFRCKQFGEKACEVQVLDLPPWVKQMQEVHEKLDQEDCPKLDHLKRALEKGDSIDAYSATHGGEANAMGDFVNELAFRPDIQKKFRLFYSMGCDDAALGDKSKTAMLAMKAGFATFVGHKGFSISPVAFNSLKNSLSAGKSIGPTVEKINQSIKGGALTDGTEMHVAGDPLTTTRRRPNLKVPSKYCIMNRGKVSLSELNEKGKGCVNDDILMEYYLKYPKLVDEKYCSSFDPLVYQQIQRSYLAMPICAALGHSMKQIDKTAIWEYVKDEIVAHVKKGFICGNRGEKARLFYCFAHWADGSKEAHKGFAVHLRSDPDLNLEANAILQEMDKLSPADCQSK